MFRYTSFDTCSQKPTKAALIGLVAALLVTSSYGFQQGFHYKSAVGRSTNLAPMPRTEFQFRPANLVSSPSFTRTSTLPSSSTALSMTLEDVNTFYATYPLQAAVLTCGVKASFADLIAQVRSWSESERAIELRRNVAYIIYGGIFIGLMCHIEYDIVFPHLFGTGHDAATVVKEVLFDNLVSAPLMWLPPAYFIKSLMFGYPLKEGLDRYKTDIEEGLLLKYWTVWFPAQTISFSLLPDHLRVAFMAAVSFCWFIVLSSAQSQTDNNAQAAADAATAKMATEAS